MADDKVPEITDEDFLDVDLAEAEDNPEAFAHARAKLEERCKSAGIELQERKNRLRDTHLIVELPSGRNTRPLILTNREEINNLLSVSFEQYILLGNYQAICSYKDGTIEALITPLARYLSPHIIFARLFGRPIRRISEEEFANFQMELPAEGERGEIELWLQSASKPLKVLSDRGRGSLALSLAITGLEVSRHSEAVDLLERIADSLFSRLTLPTASP